ncbi:MAG: glycerophosphodiester phosphodiesterase [Verrucomicrobiota bacterium]
MMGWRERSATSVRAYRDVFVRRAGQFVGFEILFLLLAASVLAPVSGILGTAILSWSGSGAVSNFDLASFFLSPKGWLFVVVIFVLGATGFFFQTGGLMVVAAASMTGKRIRLVGLLRYLGGRIRDLLELGLRMLAGYLCLALPAVVVAGVCFLIFLSEFDIYFYVQTRPLEYWLALGITGVAWVVCGYLALRLFVRWLFAVPALIFEGRPPRVALERSRELVGTDWVRVMGLVVGWSLMMIVLVIGSTAVLAMFRWVIVLLVGGNVPLAIAMVGVVLGVELCVAVAVNFILVVTFSIFTVRWFRERTSVLEIPDSEHLGERTWVDETGRGIPLRRWLWMGATAVVLVSGVICYGILETMDVTDDDVSVTAHRGSSLAAPENTMPAIELAIEEGSDYIEIDVQQTADGVLILVHDTDMKRLAGVPRQVSEMTYEEIGALDVGRWFGEEFAGERAPTLEEVIDVAKAGGAKLNIEMKFAGSDVSMAKDVAAMVRQKEFEEDCVITSLSYDGVMAVRESDPELRTGLIVTASVGDLTRLDVDLLSVSARAVSRDLIDRARRAGKEVHVWTVNQAGDMNTMIHLGVDNILTDRPAVLVELLEERAGMSKAERSMLRLGDVVRGRL